MKTVLCNSYSTCRVNLNYIYFKMQNTLYTIQKTHSFFLSFFLVILARSNFDHYARECVFGILKKEKQHKTKKKQEKSFGCVFFTK